MSFLSLTTVENETGFSREVLRKWELRYGFPQPQRDEHGDRVYSQTDARKLRLLKQLTDQGHRPSKVVPLTEKQLSDLCIMLAAERAKQITPVQRAFIDDIQKGQQEAFHQRLVSLAQAQGVLHVVTEIIAPLTTLVGHQWEEGSMSIYDEHLYTMCVMGYLRSIQPNAPAPDAPSVLLASASGEQHSLGLLMVECLLRQFGARCINLGTQVPTAEIVKAASAHEVDAVALSYSSAFKRTALRDSIHEIRQALPKRIPLWVGGNATQHFPVGRGIQRLGLNELEQALQTRH